MRRIAVLIVAGALAVPAVTTAQNPGPDASVTPGAETRLCVTVTVPSGVAPTVETLTSGALEVESVVAIEECYPGPTEGVTFVPYEKTGYFDDWSATMSKVNDNAFKVIKRENQFNDAPPKGSRVVLVTFKLKNESEDGAIDPSFAIKPALYSKSTGDGFDAYDGVLPGNGVYGDPIPPGRNRSITLAYVVPKDVKRSDLSLYMQGESEYVELDLAPVE